MDRNYGCLTLNIWVIYNMNINWDILGYNAIIIHYNGILCLILDTLQNVRLLAGSVNTYSHETTNTDISATTHPSFPNMRDAHPSSGNPQLFADPEGISCFFFVGSNHSRWVRKKLDHPMRFAHVFCDVNKNHQDRTFTLWLCQNSY